jgi:hypothetical protein
MDIFDYIIQNPEKVVFEGGLIKFGYLVGNLWTVPKMITIKTVAQELNSLPQAILKINKLKEGLLKK